VDFFRSKLAHRETQFVMDGLVNLWDVERGIVGEVE
jgi:hypothetical protein